MTKPKLFFIYKTTNAITGKYYIGMHVTSRLRDGYLGSGKILKRSISKYGRMNHIREILHFCESQDDLISLESKIVTEELLSDPLCMNIRLGGKGGGKWTTEQQRENNRRSLKRQAELAEDPEWVSRRRERKGKSLRDAYASGKKVSTAKPHPEGWRHSEELLCG